MTSKINVSNKELSGLIVAAGRSTEMLKETAETITELALERDRLRAERDTYKARLDAIERILDYADRENPRISHWVSTAQIRAELWPKPVGERVNS